MIDLSIIIVNWNSAKYISQCIDSIYKNVKGISLEIIVVDNASYDECESILKKEFPEVIFIQSEKNLGFAKANNLGYKNSKGKVLLFLNPDTEIKKDAIHILFRYLESIPSAGTVGARLLNSDNSVQISCIRVFPSILNQILNAELLYKLFPRCSLWGMAPLFDKIETPAEVDAVSGACIMIKSSVFEEVDKFSTDYFMYSEDIDLCFKVWKAGWKTYYVPGATIIHHGGGSSSMTDVNTFSTVMMLESRYRFFQKTRSIVYGRFYRLAIFTVSLIRIGMLLSLWPALAVNGKSSSIKTPLKKWFANLRWTLGLEKWVKNPL